MGVAREAAPTSSTIFVFQVEKSNIHQVKWKCHVITVIKTDLSGFVTMHLGLREQCAKSLGLKATEFDILFKPVLLHCNNNPLQTRYWSLNYICIWWIRYGWQRHIRYMNECQRYMTSKRLSDAKEWTSHILLKRVNISDMWLPSIIYSKFLMQHWNKQQLQHEYKLAKMSKNILSNVPAIQYIPRNMHTVFALLCFVVVIHWLIFPYPSG